MRIFLDERAIDFVDMVPALPDTRDRVVRFDDAPDIAGIWNEFYRDENSPHLIIADSSMTSVYPPMIPISESGKLTSLSPGFDTFCGNFKYVSAAGGVVSNDHNQWLFIKRLGFWDLPKGKVDKKDYAGRDVFSAIRNAAVREVREETGVSDLRIVRSLPSTWHIYERKNRLVLKQTFWFEMRTGVNQILRPQFDEGIVEAKWVESGDLDYHINQTYRSLREFLTQILL